MVAITHSYFFLFPSAPAPRFLMKTFILKKNKKTNRQTNYKQTVSCSFPWCFLVEYLLLNLNGQIKGK